MTSPAITLINNYRAIDGLLCTSGQPSVAQLHDIAAAGYSVVVNLALHDDLRYALPDERSLVQALGMDYLHIPVPFDSPSETDLLAFFAVMRAYQGKKMWLHCAANKRVSSFLGLYRVIGLGWARGPAFALMDGIWQPDEVWSSFIASMLDKQGC